MPRITRTYTDREIDSFVKRYDDLIKQSHEAIMQRMDVFESNTSTSLEEIKVQTTKTNGSVASLKIWRAYMTGAIAVIAFVVVPVIGYVVIQADQNNARLSSVQAQVKYLSK